MPLGVALQGGGADIGRSQGGGGTAQGHAPTGGGAGGGGGVGQEGPGGGGLEGWGRRGRGPVLGVACGWRREGQNQSGHVHSGDTAVGHAHSGDTAVGHAHSGDTAVGHPMNSYNNNVKPRPPTGHMMPWSLPERTALRAWFTVIWAFTCTAAFGCCPVAVCAAAALTTAWATPPAGPVHAGRGLLASGPGAGEEEGGGDRGVGAPRLRPPWGGARVRGSLGGPTPDRVLDQGGREGARQHKEPREPLNNTFSSLA